jgi:hypothetical protein
MEKKSLGPELKNGYFLMEPEFWQCSLKLSEAIVGSLRYDLIFWVSIIVQSALTCKYAKTIKS